MGEGDGSFDPALGLSSERAAGRAIAAQAAAMALLWKDVFDEHWLTRLSIQGLGHALFVTAASAALGLVIARAALPKDGSKSGALAVLVLAVVAGAVVTILGMPLADVGVVWPTPRSTAEAVSHTISEGSIVGAMLGFTAGAAVAPIALHHRDIRRRRALDVAPPLYVAAGVSLLLTPCALLWMSPRVFAAPTIAIGLCLVIAGLLARRRRMDWLDRVSRGRVAGFHIDQVEDEEEIESLPPFTGQSLGAREVLVATSAGSGSHPFRRGESRVRLARVDRARAPSEARQTTTRAALRGLLAGIAIAFVCASPALFAAMLAHHH